jgi:anti-sigma28 factor (negative regulator of flagellin synthesis)
MKRPGHTMLNQTPATSEFDLCRVDSIRTRLADDDYTVDSLQIADKIIDLELALSGNT